MVEKDGSGVLPGTTNRLAKNARGYVVPSFGRRHQDCRLIERLGIEQETIHVEDDGSGYAGGLHIDTLVVLSYSCLHIAQSAGFVGMGADRLRWHKM